MLLKILFIFLTFLYHSSVFSKPTDNNNFNQRYLSNYFSAIVSYDNKDNELSLKYFDSTKSIFREHPKFFDKYISNLVLNNKVQEFEEKKRNYITLSFKKNEQIVNYNYVTY